MGSGYQVVRLEAPRPQSARRETRRSKRERSREFGSLLGNRRKRCDWRIGGGTQEDGIGLEVEGGGDGLEATKYQYVSFRK